MDQKNCIGTTLGKLLSILLLFQPVTAHAMTQSVETASADVATEIAVNMAPKEQMKGMILATLVRTMTGQMLIRDLGKEKAAALLSAETDKVVNKYGAEWISYLADAYRETLTPAELSDLRSAMNTQDRAAMAPLMSRVGPSMQEKATPLLKKAAAEALAEAFAAAPAKN